MEIKIDKNSPSPAYVQIEEQIQEKIFSGELALGEQLPTERILSDHAGISRGTIKRAYDELSQKGILERRQGSGTFVSQNIELLAQSNMKKAEKIKFRIVVVHGELLPVLDYIFIDGYKIPHCGEFFQFSELKNGMEQRFFRGIRQKYKKLRSFFIE